MRLDLQELTRACGDHALDGGVTMAAALEPLGGPGTPVAPPTYAPSQRGEGPQYQRERRWWGAGEDAEAVEAIVVDNVPSQANRCERALEHRAEALGLPELVLDLDGVGALPAHLPRRLSSFAFPHRVADAYLRDAELDGTSFPSSEVGRALLAATADQAQPLLRWFPQALVYGFWQSHLGKSRTQAKLARAWRSEIVGYQPAGGQARRLGLKGDPLNLATEETVQVDELDETRWALGTAKPEKAVKPQKTRLSELGHGQVPVSGADAPPAAVSFAAIEQRSTLSLPDLRRVAVGDPDRNAAARALLAALALVAHRAAHAGAFSLRSGADMRAVETTWTWLGEDGAEPLDPLALGDALELFSAAVGQAESAGLPVGASGWDPRVLELAPSDALAKAIQATYPPVD